MAYTSQPDSFFGALVEAMTSNPTGAYADLDAVMGRASLVSTLGKDALPVYDLLRAAAVAGAETEYRAARSQDPDGEITRLLRKHLFGKDTTAYNRIMDWEKPSV